MQGNENKAGTNQTKVGAVMVVGGGICGMQSALDLANSGFKVYLVEETTAIGGRMSQLDKTFPTNDCSMCMISPKLIDVEKHHNMTAFESLTRQAKLYRSWGDCHGYYLVATGYADVMLDPVMNPWDMIPLVPIIEGAGGRITNWYGGDVLSGQGTVATAGDIHDLVIQSLNPGKDL